MLPRSTHSRMQREAAKGKQGGRTMEIQRLIARSLRAMVDLKALGERAIVMLFKRMAAHELHPLLVLQSHYVMRSTV